MTAYPRGINRVRAVSVLGAGALAVALSLPGLAGAAPSARATVAGSVPSWANSAAFKGAVSASAHLGFRVYLDWRGGSTAASYATAVSTPGNALYRHFLSSAQFRAKFAPAASDIAAVQNWLRASGFKVDYSPLNNLYVAAEGTVAQATAAFGTTFGQYSVAGQTLRAPESAISVPSSLANVVSSVVGLDETAALVHTDHVVSDAAPSAGFRNAHPCSTFFGELTYAESSPHYSYAPCGYTPAQLQGAYGVASAIAGGNDGHGVTVGIIDAYASPTIVSDANTYSSLHHLPQLTSATFKQVVAPGTYNVMDNSHQSPSGWYGEETLDVEAVHSMAPGANIVFVGAPNNYQDLDAAMNHMVDRHLADIVTNSYGWSTELLPSGYVKPLNSILIQAAAEGITVTFSSGDSGDETGGVQANWPSATPDWPAVSPWVTAVGGTSLAVGSANNYMFETGWETGKAKQAFDGVSWKPPFYVYGSGGGTSRIFPQPKYQAGVVPESMSKIHGGAAMRVVPDVSMLGDPSTGFLVGQTQSFPDGAYYDEYRIGGTSLSSPLFAGTLALAEQGAGHEFGLVNGALYKQFGTSAYTDVQSPSELGLTADQLGVVRVDYKNGVDASGGTVRTLRLFSFDSGLTIHTVTGYDNVTGVGSPNGAAFLTALG